MSLLLKMPRKDRRGSKPRCHILTHGTRNEVAERLTSLIAPFGSVTENDVWMPEGFASLIEAQLHDAPRLLDASIGRDLQRWWLAVTHANAKTPNLDIASTCTIDGRPGLLLVEAKAHDGELEAEAAGKRLRVDASAGSVANHDQIGRAIEQARLALSQSTGRPWGISRDFHYQMSNRFAWAWRVTSAGIPVVLVYLGFLDAEEMTDGLRRLLSSHDDWTNSVMNQSRALVEPGLWNTAFSSGRATMAPLIRSLRVDIADQ